MKNLGNDPASVLTKDSQIRGNNRSYNYGIRSEKALQAEINSWIYKVKGTDRVVEVIGFVATLEDAENYKWPDKEIFELGEFVRDGKIVKENPCLSNPFNY